MHNANCHIYREIEKKNGKKYLYVWRFCRITPLRKLKKLAKLLNYGHFVKQIEKMIKNFVKIKKSILTACFAIFAKK